MDVTGECHLLFVPVRESGSGVLALRTGRLPSGQRVGLAYTSAAALLSALGQGQPWIRLHEHAMRDMLEPAGIDQIRVDACPSAPPGTTATAARLRRGSHPPRPPRVTLTHQRPTTTMSHCRGQNHHVVTLPWLRPEASGPPVDQLRLVCGFGRDSTRTADKPLAWPGPGRLPVPRAPAPPPGVLAGARK
jgi:hypothetical protein